MRRIASGSSSYLSAAASLPQGDGYLAQRSFHPHLNVYLLTIFEDKPSWPSGSLLVRAWFKANRGRAVFDSIGIGRELRARIPEEKCHAVSFLSWHPNRRSDPALDDDGKLRYKVSALVGTDGGVSEVAPQAIEAKVADSCRPLTPSWIRVADYCGSQPATTARGDPSLSTESRRGWPDSSLPDMSHAAPTRRTGRRSAVKALD